MTLNSIKDIKLHKEQKAGNCKNIVYILTRDYNNSKILKRKQKS